MTMDSDWLSNAEIRSMLERGNRQAVLAYVHESPLRAVNADCTFLVMVRDHDAWFLEGQGWHDANRPVGNIDGSCRQMINIYEGGSWTKMPIPMSVRINSVKRDSDAFVFTTSRGEIRSPQRYVWLAVHDSMTGRGLSEEEIEHNFLKLEGKAPLKWHKYDDDKTASTLGKKPS